jgi:hypothetical protein
MRRLCSLLAFTIVLCAASWPAQATVLRINEFVANHVGTDSHEYVEIFFQSGNYDLSGFTILQIEGDGTGAGTIDGAYAVGTTNAGGYWTTGYLNNMIENGTITLLLVNSFTGSVGDDLDTDNDGVLDSEPWYNGLVYDAVAVSDGGAADRTYATTVLTPSFDGGAFTPGGASLIPDAGASWVRNDFDGRGLPGFTGTPTTGEALNTPGAENQLWIAPEDPVINEWLANHTGADAHEFVEVFGLADTDYSHLTLIAVEGDGASAGVIDAIYTVGTTDANGFWHNYPLAADALENGTNTFILGEGFFGSVGQDLDTNNDGVLETNPFARVVDDVAVSDGTAGDDVYSATVLASNYDGVAGEPGGASRIPNGTDTDSAADWTRNDFDGDGLTGMTGTPALLEARNTPGTKNLTAIDTEPPVITIDPSRSVLWPPNHRLLEVCIAVTASDEREPAPTWVLTSVTSSEDDDGKGDGHTKYDIRDAATGTDDVCFLLRSERSGGGDGREYTIVYTATDGAGNTSTGTAVVTVPHDQSGAALASTGFAADGFSIGAGADEFALVIPSTVRTADGSGWIDEGLHAAAIDPHLAYVGNALGVVRPLRSDVREVTGDGLDDMVLYYSARAALSLDPRRGSGEGDAALALHFESPDGTQLFVESIFGLGTPVSDTGGLPVDGGASLRAGLNALAIHPNPFNPQTTVSVEMVAAGPATVRIFDVRGALVKTLQSGNLPVGRHELRWDGRDNTGVAVASGVYFVSLQAGDTRIVKRAVLLK